MRKDLPRSLRRGRPAAAACLLALAIFGSPSPLPAEDRPVLAVLGLRLKDVDLATAALYEEALGSALYRTAAVEVVDRERREAALEEIAFSASALADEQAQIEAGRFLSAAYIVTGSLGRYGDKLVAALRLVETATSRLRGGVEELYEDEAELLDEVDSLARLLVREIAGAAAARGRPLPPAKPAPAAGGPGAASGPAAGASPPWTPIQLSIFSPLQIFPPKSAVRGLRLSLGYGDNESVYGADLGLVRFVRGETIGLQAGLYARTGSLVGVQVNAVGHADRVLVLQANALLNTAGSVAGAQLGLVNLAEEVVGAQIGLYNSAGLLRGVQLGLVNVVRYGEWAGFMPVLNLRF